MKAVGILLICICAGVPLWIIYSLVLFPYGRKSKRKEVRAMTPATTVTPTLQPRVDPDADDRVWFFAPSTKEKVERARAELPMLYTKLQILQQKIVGLKVDANREEGTLMQHDVGGVLGLFVTAASGSGLIKAQQEEREIKAKASELEKDIEEKEKLISRYDTLAKKYAQ